MARNPKATKKKTQDRRPRTSAAGNRARRGRPKFCVFCSEHATWVDYKDVGLLKRFISDRGRIKSRGSTGTCAQHQRDVATAVKTARELALLPYTVRTAGTESRSGRGGDRRGGGAPQPRVEASPSDTSEPAPEGTDDETDQAEIKEADEVSNGSIAAPV